MRYKPILSINIDENEMDDFLYVKSHNNEATFGIRTECGALKKNHLKSLSFVMAVREALHQTGYDEEHVLVQIFSDLEKSLKECLVAQTLSDLKKGDSRNHE